MNDEAEPASRQPQDSRENIESLRRELRALRRVSLLAIAGLTVALVAVAVWMDRRHLAWRADTIYARRFVVQDAGREAAELGMMKNSHYSQLLLGPDDRRTPGVAIGEMGQVHVRTGRWTTSLMGNHFMISDRDTPHLMFGTWFDDSTFWQPGKVTHRTDASWETPIDSILSSSFQGALGLPKTPYASGRRGR